MCEQLHKAWKQLFKQYAYWLNMDKLNDELIGTFDFGGGGLEVPAPGNLFKQRLLSTIQDIVLIGNAMGPKYRQVAFNLMAHNRYPTRFSPMMHVLTNKGNEPRAYDSNDWAELRDAVLGADYKGSRTIYFRHIEPAGISYSLTMLEYRKILLYQISNGLVSLGVPDSLYEESLKQITHAILSAYECFSHYKQEHAAFLFLYHQWSRSRSKPVRTYLTSKL
jgi:hypothetical protein